MKPTSKLPKLALAVTAASVLSCGSAAAAYHGDQPTGNHAKPHSSSATGEPTNVAHGAAEVLRNQMQQPADKRIPRKIVDNAQCIGVFPSVVKAGFVVGGSHGDGVISCRDSAGNWKKSAPTYFELSSGSVGLQAGAQSSELVMLFMTKQSAQDLLNSKLKLGADIGVAAGPTGAHAKVDTAPAPVLTYRLDQEGAFAGAEIKGAVISVDDEANRKVYGSQVNPKSLLFGNHPVPSDAKPYEEALAHFAPGKDQSNSLKVE